MTERNWPLLIQTMQHIIDHPERWDQTDWVTTCGTAFCFAGHAAVISGGKQLQNLDLFPYRDNQEHFNGFVTLEDRELAARVEAQEYSRVAPRHTTAGVPAYGMEEVGRVALGLRQGDSWRLFEGENTLGDLLAHLRDWATEDGVALPESWPTNLPTNMYDQDHEDDEW